MSSRDGKEEADDAAADDNVDDNDDSCAEARPSADGVAAPTVVDDDDDIGGEELSLPQFIDDEPRVGSAGFSSRDSGFSARSDAEGERLEEPEDEDDDDDDDDDDDVDDDDDGSAEDDGSADDDDDDDSFDDDDDDGSVDATLAVAFSRASARVADKEPSVRPARAASNARSRRSSIERCSVFKTAICSAWR